ncbi:AMIN-like domain-containing (lipo)protein [Mycetocola zhadangensis]|uniref:AMIN-like domain-containing protein n=1 Tax=Mycetocola zhadangensis TaxID=1164595 RepID=A0A3L7J1Q5_9MICO|nr:hypothetical protein [Mycetocola zhadangensis]RLQ84473.1 hypothetical protein D9V28_09815 [Mycetocola zhadangensis]GGE92692.1 hypothetical protein GCM10011313_14570 [Mycetocola zhadangensis]
MKRSVALMISALMGVVFLSAGSVTATAAPYCGITWGSLPDSQSLSAPDAPITNARSGEHPCFDRFVLDVRGDIHGFDVRYVPEVLSDGSGTPVPLRGGADLRVIALAPAYDINNNNAVTYDPAVDSEALNVEGYETFRQVAFAGSFEAQTTFGIGVRARLPFRTLILDGPGDGSRLVVDVAHRW